MTGREQTEYRIGRLYDRLAREDLAELGVRVEVHGAGAMVRGSVTSPECRAEVLRIAAEELAGVEWREDVTVCRPVPPDHSEELW
ncbi:hypothetical protein ABZY31_23640 [Streptomyces sp. NPDC006529]|uniref:hypothetical protein n=1 Tax=Streptomyces sp. NPDC006529 TaxID=3157177 RepID=UPI0033B7D54A